MNCYICSKELRMKNMIHMAVYENYGGRVDYMCLDCYKKTKFLKKLIVGSKQS